MQNSGRPISPPKRATGRARRAQNGKEYYAARNETLRRHEQAQAELNAAAEQRRIEARRAETERAAREQAAVTVRQAAIEARLCLPGYWGDKTRLPLFRD